MKKILIELICKTKTGQSSLISDTVIIQTKPFELGLRIKNIGSTPISGFTINNIKLESSDSQDIILNFDKSFNVDTLNPDDIKEIWIEKTGTYMHGLVCVKLNISPSNDNGVIEAHQKDHFTKQISSPFKNFWNDFFYIRSRTEDIQNKSNEIMIYLMVITVGVAILNLLFFYKYQIQPVIDEYNRREYEAVNFCKNNPSGTWPKTNGGSYTCNEVLKISGDSITTKN